MKKDGIIPFLLFMDLIKVRLLKNRKLIMIYKLFIKEFILNLILNSLNILNFMDFRKSLVILMGF